GGAATTSMTSAERRHGDRGRNCGAGDHDAWLPSALPTALARAVPIAVGVVVLIAGAHQFSAWKARHLNALAGHHHNWLDVCALPGIAYRLYTIVLSQHHTHEQDDPDRAALSTQPLTAHTGNLRPSGEVHGRFFVARVGRRMPDHTWHRTSIFSIGQPRGRRARDHPPGTLSAPGALPPPTCPAWLSQHARESEASSGRLWCGPLRWMHFSPVLKGPRGMEDRAC